MKRTWAIAARIAAIPMIVALSFAMALFGQVSSTHTAYAADGGKDSARVLFAGNSFTSYKGNDLGRMLSKLASANGKQVVYKGAVFGKASLLDFTAFSAVPDRYGEFESKLANGTWDYVVLQEKTTYPIDNPLEMYLGTQMLADRVHAVQPNAEVLLYMTAGYCDGTAVSLNGENQVLSVMRFSAHVQAVCEDVGARLGIRVVPVGMYANKFATVSAPANIAGALIGDDCKHPSAAGYYLGACAFYEAIFGELPEKTVDALSDPSPSLQKSILGVLGTTITAAPKAMALAVGQSARISYTVAKPSDDEDVGTMPIDGPDGGNSNAGGAAGGDQGGFGNGGDGQGSSGSGATSTSGNGRLVVASLRGGVAAVSGNTGEGSGVSKLQRGESQSALAFESLDPGIASVDASGLVTARSLGKTVVTVQDSSGERAACLVSVEPNDLIQNKLAFEGRTYSVTIGGVFKVDPRVSASIGPCRLQWSSSDARVAEVDAMGAVTAKRAGKTTITIADQVSGAHASYTVHVKLSTPYGLSAKTVSAKKKGKKVAAMKVAWKGVSGAKSYRVYRATGAKGAFKYIGSANAKSFVDTAVPANKYVRYAVQAENGVIAQRSDRSDYLSVVMPSATKLKARAIGKSKSVKLTWNKRSVASKYQIYRAVGKGKYKLVKTISKNTTRTWKDKNVKRGKRYSYKVRSYSVCDGKRYYSLFSNVKKVTVKKA